MWSKECLVFVLILAFCNNAPDISISPFSLLSQISQCTLGFKVSADFQFAVCGTNSNVYVYSWNTVNFVQGQQILSSDAYSFLITNDALAIGVRTYDRMKVFSRATTGQNFAEIVDQACEQARFHLTDNKLHLTFQSTDSKLKYFKLDQSTTVFAFEFPCTGGCDSSISEDGSIIVAAESGTGLKIYVWDGTDYNQQVSETYNHQILSLSVNFEDMTEIFITVADSSTKTNYVYTYDGSGSSVTEKNSFILSKSDGTQMSSIYTEIGSTNQWLALTSGGYYALGRLNNGLYSQITSVSGQWKQISGVIYEMSFQKITGDAIIHTITIDDYGTSIYRKQPPIDCTTKTNSVGTVSQYQCSCASNYLWNNSTKQCTEISCTVVNCVSCNIAENCTNCQTGFRAEAGSCVCETGTLSQTSNLCVSCSIDNCQRCDVEDSCALCSNSLILNSNACQCPNGQSLQSDGSCIENIQPAEPAEPGDPVEPTEPAEPALSVEPWVIGVAAGGGAVVVIVIIVIIIKVKSASSATTVNAGLGVNNAVNDPQFLPQTSFSKL